MLNAGVYRLLSKAGAVSAVPIQLMSDHIFLGASLVAILSAELVLLRCSLRQAHHPVHVKAMARTGEAPLAQSSAVPARHLQQAMVSHLLHEICISCTASSTCARLRRVFVMDG